LIPAAIRSVLLGIVAAMLELCVATNQAGSATLLKLVTWAAPKSPQEGALRDFAQRVQDQAKGAIRIELIDGSKEKITFGEAVKRIKSGELAGGVIPLSSVESSIPKVATLSLPFLFADDKHLEQVIFGEIGQKLLSEISEAVQVRSLSFFQNVVVDLGSSKEPIVKSSDLRGRKLGVARDIERISFSMLGAQTQLLPFSQLQIALANEQVDTTDAVVYSGLEGRAMVEAWAPIVKYLSATEHSRGMSVLMINAGVFNALSRELQGALLDGAKQSALLNDKHLREGKQQSLVELNKKGIKIVVADRAELRGALEKLFEDPPTPIDKELLNKIRRVCRVPPFCFRL